jgi:fucose permease
MFMGAGAEFCLTFWTAAYFQLNFNATAILAGLGTGAIALGMFLGRMSIGYWVRRPEMLKHVLFWCALINIPVTLSLAFLTPDMFPARWMLFGLLFFILLIAGFCIGPYWPSLQVYGVKNLPELDSTHLYIYFSAMGIPGCGFFTWLMGFLGDHYGLSGAFYMLPATLVLYCIIILLEGWVFPRRDLPEEQ